MIDAAPAAERTIFSVSELLAGLGALFEDQVGRVFVLGAESRYSLMGASRGKYGESAGEWSPVDALGFSRVLALPGILHTRAGAD